MTYPPAGDDDSPSRGTTPDLTGHARSAHDPEPDSAGQARSAEDSPSAPQRIDARLIPPALAAWAGALVVLVASGGLDEAGARLRLAYLALVVVAGAVVAAVSLSRRRRSFVVLIALIGAAAGVVAASLHVLALNTEPLTTWAQAGRHASVVARIESAPTTPSGPSWQSAGQGMVRIRAQRVTVGSPTVDVDVPMTARIPVEVVPPIGSVVRLSGTLHASNSADSAAFVAVRDVEVVASPDRVDGLANNLRAGLHHALDGIDTGAASLVNGLAVGGTSGMPALLEQDMRTVGLSHLTAVSGGNVAIVLGAVLLLAGLLRLPLPFRVGLAVVALAFFIVLVRPQPSVLRAAVMGAITVLALLSGGRRSGPSVLSAAVLMLVVLSPPLAVSWGFALSVMATAGIVLLAPVIESKLFAFLDVDPDGLHRPRPPASTRAAPPTGSRPSLSALSRLDVAASGAVPAADSPLSLARPDIARLPAAGARTATEGRLSTVCDEIRQRLRRMPPVVVQAVALTTAAQVMTAPLIVAMGATIGWTALPANLLSAPAVPPVTILGLLAALVSPVSPPLAAMCAKAAAVPAAWIAAVAERMASLPGSVAPIPPGMPGVLVLVSVAMLSVLAALLWRARGRRHRRIPSGRRLVGALALGLVAVLVVSAIAGRRTWVPARWLFVACDVGQGDALVLRSTAGATVLVDTGPEPVAVDRCLADLDVTAIDLVLLTHYDADHVGGLAGVIHGRNVGAALISPVTDGAERADEVAALLARTPTTHARQGQRLALPGIDVQVLWPLATAFTSESVQNDNSIVVIAVVDGVSALLTGDIEQRAQAEIARMMPTGGVDIAKVPHHGSGNMDAALATAAHPRLAVFSVGADNDYGHPHPDALAAWGSSSAMLARTDTQGTIAVTKDATGSLAIATSG